MNKILVYTIFAILLGTVIMTAPLAVLEPIQPLPLTTEGDNNKILESERGTLGGNDMLTNQTLEDPSVDYTPEPAPELPMESTTPSEPLPEESQLCDLTSDTSLAISGLSSLGIIIVPSFLVSLGLFVYFKKQVK
jgi:hypothetical protein